MTVTATAVLPPSSSLTVTVIEYVAPAANAWVAFTVAVIRFASGLGYGSGQTRR